jgi:hypothetical protein
VVFVRPTRENITMLKRELRQPRFQSYHLCEFFAKCKSEAVVSDRGSILHMWRIGYPNWSHLACVRQALLTVET